MKNRFRFQTKLMLTIVFAIALVTLAVLWATEAKIRQTYTDQFSIEFDGLVAQLERSREQKSAEFLESCKTLASHPFLAKYLKGETDKQSREDFIDSLPDIIDRPENGRWSPLRSRTERQFRGGDLCEDAHRSLVSTLSY